MIAESAGSALWCYDGSWCQPHSDLLAFCRWTACLGPCAWRVRHVVCLVQCLALSNETGEGRRRALEVQEMNPEQERQAQAKRDEDRMRALDEDLRFLHWQISKLEKMIRTVLDQAKMIHVSTP